MKMLRILNNLLYYLKFRKPLKAAIIWYKVKKKRCFVWMTSKSQRDQTLSIVAQTRTKILITYHFTLKAALI